MREAGLSCEVLCPTKIRSLRRKSGEKKETLSPFNLYGLWAAGRAALGGTEPTEREKDARFNLFFSFSSFLHKVAISLAVYVFWFRFLLRGQKHICLIDYLLSLDRRLDFF
ncbi:hypothetical protein AVEN_222663-1 [Araneus ventricosus]|uniref:Uncharacterized protein n=1 Tax=Araneus ventricosus TaxID=182803 RepID=A0A4Y2T6Z9_ARAVE|nr:hypothetical protein AVEN_243177-1 [Araneus ventricosus]GBN94921.1 hypothetical protein AVEN_222663-1 [Araneus ventricosus]